ncbi:MAG: MFS transporter [Collinsella sp.]
MAVTGIFAGRISDKIGPRNVVIAAAACYGVGWFMSGTVTEPWQFYLWFSLVAAVGNGLGYNPALTTGQKWFIDKKGLASGITLAASTAGPAVLSPVLASLLIPSLGIFGALKALGVIFFVTIAASALFLKAPEAGWLPRASRPQGRARAGTFGDLTRARWSRPRASGSSSSPSPLPPPRAPCSWARLPPSPPFSSSPTPRAPRPSPSAVWWSPSTPAPTWSAVCPLARSSTSSAPISRCSSALSSPSSHSSSCR